MGKPLKNKNLYSIINKKLNELKHLSNYRKILVCTGEGILM